MGGCHVDFEVKYEEKPAPQRKKVGRKRQQRGRAGAERGGTGLAGWGARGDQWPPRLGKIGGIRKQRASYVMLMSLDLALPAVRNEQTILIRGVT